MQHLGFTRLGNPHGYPLVIIHGWACDGSFLLPLAEMFPDRDVYLIDLPGYGRSASLASIAGDLAATNYFLLNTIPYGADVISWSFGTLYALHAINTITDPCINLESYARTVTSNPEVRRIIRNPNHPCCHHTNPCCAEFINKHDLLKTGHYHHDLLNKPSISHYQIHGSHNEHHHSHVTCARLLRAPFSVKSSRNSTVLYSSHNTNSGSSSSSGCSGRCYCRCGRNLNRSRMFGGNNSLKLTNNTLKSSILSEPKATYLNCSKRIHRGYITGYWEHHHSHHQLARLKKYIRQQLNIRKSIPTDMTERHSILSSCLSHNHNQPFIRSLVTICGSPRFPGDPNWIGLSPVKILKCNIKLTPPRLERVVNMFYRLMSVNRMGNTPENNFIRKLIDQQPKVPYDVLMAGIQLVTYLDERPTLQHMSLPSLHLFGAHDRLVPCSLAEKFKGNPLHRAYVFDQSAHSPYLSEPEEFRQIIRAFYDRIADQFVQGCNNGLEPSQASGNGTSDRSCYSSS